MDAFNDENGMASQNPNNKQCVSERLQRYEKIACPALHPNQAATRRPRCPAPPPAPGTPAPAACLLDPRRRHHASASGDALNARPAARAAPLSLRAGCLGTYDTHAGLQPPAPPMVDPRRRHNALAARAASPTRARLHPSPHAARDASLCRPAHGSGRPAMPPATSVVQPAIGT
ncbi:hypothetical protein U9M48_030853 [Paspalum notatum var. saurae]|uniref:Uncharacterized protein n=1 Tax=Paspalum notatum var. saurae TaxID=547442 RepID=A0AAQ3U1C6_PASNO